MRPIDPETLIQIQDLIVPRLNRRWAGQPDDAVMTYNILVDCKHEIVDLLVDRGWDKNDAWARVSKLRVEKKLVEHPDDSAGTSINAGVSINIVDS